MKQDVIHNLQACGFTKDQAKILIQKAEKHYGWKLKSSRSVQTAVKWVLQGAHEFDKYASKPKVSLQQKRRQVQQSLSELLGVTPIHAKYIIKYVEEKYHKKIIDSQKNVAAAITYIFHRYHQNDFMNVATSDPNYYQYLLQLSPGNVPTGMTQQQIQALSTLPYKDYKSRKKQSQAQQKFKECSICLDEFDTNDTIIEIMSCPHIFHKECAKKWFSKNKTCPVCKKQVK